MFRLPRGLRLCKILPAWNSPLRSACCSREHPSLCLLPPVPQNWPRTLAVRAPHSRPLPAWSRGPCTGSLRRTTRRRAGETAPGPVVPVPGHCAWSRGPRYRDHEAKPAATAVAVTIVQSCPHASQAVPQVAASPVESRPLPPVRGRGFGSCLARPADNDPGHMIPCVGAVSPTPKSACPRRAKPLPPSTAPRARGVPGFPPRSRPSLRWARCHRPPDSSPPPSPTQAHRVPSVSPPRRPAAPCWGPPGFARPWRVGLDRTAASTAASCQNSCRSAFGG